MNARDNIAARWNPEWDGRTDLARLGREVRKVLQFIESVPSKRATLVAEGRLSRKGLDEAVRDHFASAVVPHLRRAAWEAERSITAIANRCAHLGRVEYDKADLVAANLRREMRSHLCAMDQAARIAAITANRQMREAAFEGPALLSGLDEDTRNDLRRRLALNDFPEEAAYLGEEEEAIKVANAAIKRAVDVLQEAAGFAGNDRAFDDWMAASSVVVEREIEAEKRRAAAPTAATASSGDDLAAEVRRDIHRIFAEAFPTIFKSAA
jgi:hypothetical protein